jgi:6-phosphogluconolactonase (cycloisomerase 2 family)
VLTAALASSVLLVLAAPVAASAATTTALKKPDPAATSALVRRSAIDAGVPGHGFPGHRGQGYGFGQSVFVQTDAPTGNQIDVFNRGADGQLNLAGTYSTGGNGGAESGAVVDSLASQNSLVYDAATNALYAVNAGSDTISVFGVFGDRLALLEVLPSGGQFPVSIAVQGGLLYVLNAGGAGTVQGFGRYGPFLFPIWGDSQSLGLDNSVPPNYLMSPGDIGFTPDGRQLIVTTKTSGSDIDVFSVGSFGRLSAPVVNPSITPAPFSFTFGPGNHLVVAEAGTSNVSTYMVNPDGTLTDDSTLTDGQTALCWITAARGFFYVANAGSNNLSAYRVGVNGELSLVGSTGVVASTGTGPIDMAATPDGQYLYAEAGGSGAVDEFAVNGNGTLTAIGTVGSLRPGLEGIAAD